MSVPDAVMREADDLARKIIDLFHQEAVPSEIALLAMTRVTEKIKKLVHNLVVMEEQCRETSYKFNN